MQDIDECAAVNCGPNARCTQPTVGNYQCVCTTGYFGSISQNMSPMVCTAFPVCPAQTSDPSMALSRKVFLLGSWH